ncbi:hypothetical protein Ae201684P_007672 [Aphanomyces euteiches]|nr:hypothetical protein Ae201684P_007672 [Aphanomyces euteiches]KAH9150699.1 hypothetical protein AeRB84_006507 [Aphanomyces euteiches]
MTSLVPVGLTVGGAVLSVENNLVPYPTIIIEISYKNEDLAGIQGKLVRWMVGTSVQVAIGIKIFALGLRRVAILHQRGLPIQQVEFGEPLLPPLEISFRLASIYTGVPLPPILAALDYPQSTIDLLALRTFIGERIFEERGNAADLQAAAFVAPADAE